MVSIRCTRLVLPIDDLTASRSQISTKFTSTLKLSHSCVNSYGRAVDGIGSQTDFRIVMSAAITATCSAVIPEAQASVPAPPRAMPAFLKRGVRGLPREYESLYFPAENPCPTAPCCRKESRRGIDWCRRWDTCTRFLTVAGMHRFDSIFICVSSGLFLSVLNNDAAIQQLCTNFMERLFRLFRASLRSAIKALISGW
jgi:hypothetical protein